MADPSTTTVIIPAFNEQGVIADVVAGVRATGSWHEILVIDDGSADATADRARAAGARVISQPYNKGIGAAIKQGVRAASGTHLVILDGDGQHRPEDALRLVACLGNYDLAVGARSPSTQATIGRRLGNALLNRLATRLAQHPVKDLTSGFRAARTAQLRQFLHMLPNGFSAATTITLAYIRAGYSVAFEPIDARPRTGSSSIRFARDGFKFWLILLRVVTIYSPLRVFRSGQPSVASWRRRLCALDHRDTAQRYQHICRANRHGRSGLPDRPRVGSDRHAQTWPRRT